MTTNRLPLQPTSYEFWSQKYQLRDPHGKPIDKTVEDSYRRVAKALASVEPRDQQEWEDAFYEVMVGGCTPAGRIMSNAGAEKYKSGTSLINCTVSRTVEDSMDGILDAVKEAGLTLSAGCGIGYEFSTLRPKDAYVDGAGATTSGPLSFMEIFDSMCQTIASAGGRRGAQMGTFAVWHPDVVRFIQKKRENGKLRQFNLSLLIDDEFIEAVKADSDYKLVFPTRHREIALGLASEDDLHWKPLFWEKAYCEKMGYVIEERDGVDMIGCKVYETVQAAELWDIIMKSTYDYAEPGFLLIDRINEMNPNNGFEIIRATNPCVSGDTMVDVRIDSEESSMRIDELVRVYKERYTTSSIEVLSYNTQTENVEYKTVLNALKTREDAELLELELDTGEILKLTPDHLVYTNTRGYVEARDLIADDDIVASSISTLKQLRKVPNEDVYDITVQDNHNFRANGVIVHNCGEQPLPPWAACLLGSPNLAMYVRNPFTDDAYFDFEAFRNDIAVFTRALDNVVELNGLPLAEQRASIEATRRHGMGVMGVGSAMTMLGMQYGKADSLNWFNDVMKELVITGFAAGIQLAKEKGPAPILTQSTNGVSNLQLWLNSPYMQRIFNENPNLYKEASTVGCRFTHHSSIAPTGTIALTVNNNVSNGIEPTFSHKYTRNAIIPGRKTKKAVDVYSYEMLLYKELTGNDEVPETFSTTDNVSVTEHVDVQAVAQYWLDSSCSKTINVPSDIPFEDFKNVYLYAYEKGLKGCTTFRFNPEAFQGVLVKDGDLQETEYIFLTEDGQEIIAAGNQVIEYDGEEHSAANLFDAIKEGTYGTY